LESAKRPLPHSEDIPVPFLTSQPELPLSHFEILENLHCTTHSEDEENLPKPQRFTQEELNDLVRDLNLSKAASELLASRLKEKNCLPSS